MVESHVQLVVGARCGSGHEGGAGLGDETFSRRSCPRAPSHRRSRKPSPTSGPGTEGKDQLTRNRSGPSTCQPSSHGCNKGSGARGRGSELSGGSLGPDGILIPRGQPPVGKAGTPRVDKP